MGRDYSSVDAAFGFEPYGPILRTSMYAVQTAPVINVMMNDLVIHGGTMVSTSQGYMPIIEDSAVPDGNADIVGGVVGIFDENMEPALYIAATEVGDGTIAGYVLVADHPQQLFLAQEDGTTNAIDLADVGQNANIVSGTICAGDTNTGRSKQEIASDTISATAALNVRCIRPHEDDTPGDDTNCYCRWVCMINEHHYLVAGDGI